MGRKNDIVLEYLKDTARFADLYNGGCFGGEQIVPAEELLEGSEVYHQEDLRQNQYAAKSRNTEKKDRGETSAKIRDVKKRLKSGENLRILAIENQLSEDYTMPWRHMNYDTLEYGAQIKEIKSQNKKEKRLKSGEEFLCGLTKEDRLDPVYTVCLYLGEKPWQGPRSLKDMMNAGAVKEPWKNGLLIIR